MWIDILLDALIDSTKMLPFLFAAFLFIEYLEHKAHGQKIIDGFRKYGAVGGAVLGCIPQCGFSAMAANLYSGGVITVGTLIAVFLSTSDEAIIILLGNPGNAENVLKLIGCKVLIGIIAGLLIDFVVKRFRKYDKKVGDVCTDCGCRDGHGILVPAIKHTLKIYIFLIAVSFLIAAIIELIGEENFKNVILSDSIFQPVIAALIGLIPNCATSVILTELYITGSISFASVLAGLCANAGIGILVLFRSNKNVKENIIIIVVLYMISVLSGIIAGLF